MNGHPEASVARIFANNGGVVGAGFLVADNQVVTCAHVVAQALQVDSSSVAVPQETFHLDFPLVAQGDEQHRQEAEAQRQEAQKQQQMALAHGLAAQAELLRNQYPDLIERSVLLASTPRRSPASPSPGNPGS